MLSADQIARFHDTGCLVVEDAVTPAQLEAARTQLCAWVAESRAHDCTVEIPEQPRSASFFTVQEQARAG